MKFNLVPRKRSTAVLVLLALLVLLLLPSSGRAMNSANFRLDWFAPMTGTGGALSSPNFSMNLTVGQTVTGSEASSGYAMNLGYWQNWNPLPVLLPIAVKP